MTWTLRVSDSLLGVIRRDLRREHAHAWERVGFVYARMGNRSGGEMQVLPYAYEPVADEHYLRDSKVGAKIDGHAIRAAMQHALTHGVGVFHVHMHEHEGLPGYSAVDMESYPQLVAAFQSVAPRVAHGAMLLSHDLLHCLVWMPQRRSPAPGGRIVIVGRPLRIVSVTEDLYA